MKRQMKEAPSYAALMQHRARPDVVGRDADGLHLEFRWYEKTVCAFLGFGPNRTWTTWFQRRVEDEGALLPHVIAEAVVNEVETVYPVKLPQDYAERLARKADRLYALNPDCRKKMKAKSDRGREWLYIFTRHWLAGMLADENPTLFKALPQNFKNGLPL